MKSNRPFFLIAIASHQRNEYRQLEVQVDKPGMVARSLQGYYAQP